MSTTTSSIHNIKSRLPTSNSINNMTTNGTDTKSSRTYLKKPLSATNIVQDSPSTNGRDHHLEKRIVLSNGFHPDTSIKPILVDEKSIDNHHHHHNGHYTNELSEDSTTHSSSSTIMFHAIAPARTLGETNNKQKSSDEPMSAASRRIANILAHGRIKTMSNAVTSGSDEEGESSSHHSHGQSSSSSSIDTDADESDPKSHSNNNNINNNTKQISKPRRFQKTRKTSFSSVNNTNNYTPPISRTIVRKDDQRHRSSSNDEVHTEINSINDESSSNNRRLKPYALKRRDHFATTTTTDDDTNKFHRYHPLDNLELNGKAFPSESTGSSPIPTNPTSINPIPARKASRFQVKSIRKSQQQQFLLANAAAAKSSNDDDCSVSHQRVKLSFKALFTDRKHTNTPTTDGEHSTTNTDNIVNGAVSVLKTVRNGGYSGHHRVRFHVTQHKKHESPAEEEKVSTATVHLPAPAPASSAASAQGEDEEEEEAVAKSPDNRFIKYAKEIGRGAFKTVYRGLDTETSVAVAWCELQEFAHFDKHERARFKEEAEMLKKLQHQNIVRFYDFWEETNPRTNKKVIILVTELMTSGSLKGYIRNFKGQKEEKRINVMKKWCRQILKGLAYLHSRNPPVIHRDLKCDNVFISSTTGCVKIGDLGLATFKTQTFAKSMRGTMEFMAPEMFDEKYDELVDIYSFGLCMLEMITDEYPYNECKVLTAVIKRVTAGLKPDCYYKVESEDVREVIDCCIRTKKEERLSVQDLLQHSFFLDDNGLRIDLVRDSSNDSTVTIKNDTIDLKLKIVDKAKRKALHAENKVSSTVFEAILFPYNLKTDTPERIADELIGTNYIFDEDKKFVIQSIKDRVRAMNYEILDRQAGVFSGDGKRTINQTPQSTMVHQQQQQQQQQQQTTPLLPAPQVASFVPASVPIPSIVQQTTMEQQQQQQQQQQQIVKPSSEIPTVKPVVTTEPISTTQLSELSPNIPGSAVSLVELEAALKKTFTKNNAQGANTTSTLVNDTSEPPTPIMNQDESLIPKSTASTAVIEQQQQQQTEEPGISITSESITNIPTSSASVSLQTQSQPSTMLTNQQQQILPNAHLLTQPPQSFSYSTISPSPQLINTTISNEPIKPTVPPSVLPSSSTTTESVENNHIPISPSTTPLSLPHTSEAVQPSLSSDSQPQVSGSLQQLEVLLKNTFKKQNKTTGTAHSSDGETANTTTSSVPSVSVLNNDDKNDIDSISIDSSLVLDDKKRKAVDAYTNSNLSPQQTLTISQQLNESTHFDPLISVDNGNLQELETLLKSTFQKPLTNDDTRTISPQISSTNDDISDLKSLIMDFSKTLLNKMNTIEAKIDEHHSQTRKINHVVTNTILPSLLDLTDIIQENSISNLDGRVRTKLEHIQTRIRTTQQQQQQQQQNEMKDLMDI